MAIYLNEACQQYLNEVLDTYLAVEGFVNVDNTLTGQDGDKIQVWRYQDSGAAEEVSEGNGNTGYSDIDGQKYEYGIKTVQDRIKVTDEEQQRNSRVVEMKHDILAGHIINKVRGDIMAEWKKSTNFYGCEGDVPTFDELFLGIGQLDLGVDGGENGGAEDYRIFFSPAAWRQFTLSLTDNLLIQYELINGKRKPVINGVPVEVTDLLAGHDCQCLVATNQAIRYMRAKKVATEQERDANTRTSYFYGRDVYCPYLEFNAKVVLFGKAANFEAAAGTTATIKFIAGPNAIAGAVVKFTVTPTTGKTVSAVEVDTEAVTPGADGVYSVLAVEGDHTITITEA